ncbi:MAG: H-NS histone family protein [Thiotrichaceae bacterium]
MAKVKLDKLSIKELNAILQDAEKQIESRKKTELKTIRKQVKDLIKDNGYTPGDIFPALKVAVKPTAKVAPKYKNPKDAEQTWTGRGRKPKWVEAHLNKGKKLTSLAIKT